MAKVFIHMQEIAYLTIVLDIPEEMQDRLARIMKETGNSKEQVLKYAFADGVASVEAINSYLVNYGLLPANPS